MHPPPLNTKKMSKKKIAFIVLVIILINIVCVTVSDIYSTIKWQQPILTLRMQDRGEEVLSELSSQIPLFASKENCHDGLFQTEEKETTILSLRLYIYNTPKDNRKIEHLTMQTYLDGTLYQEKNWMAIPVKKDVLYATKLDCIRTPRYANLTVVVKAVDSGGYTYQYTAVRMDKGEESDSFQQTVETTEIFDQNGTHIATLPSLLS